MREVQSSEAKTHLPRLLDEVERGETLVITRQGRPIARLVPEPDAVQARRRQAVENIRRMQKGAQRITVEELLSSRHEGHAY